MHPGKKRVELDQEKFKKGQLLVVKVPPFYDREYLYEINGAGEKLVRATLYRSPRVKKQWSFEDLELLFGNGMIRFAEDADLEKLNRAQAKSESSGENLSPTD